MGTGPAKVTENREMICSGCAKAKPDVRMRVDPFTRDIDGVETIMALCDQCEDQRADDI